MGLGFGDVAAPPNQQVNEVAGLGEQGSAFRIHLPPPRAVVVIPLVAVPQDIAFDHEDFAEHPTFHGVLGQSDGHVVAVLLHDPQVHAGFCGARVHGFAISRVERHGFFDQYVVAGSHDLDAHVGVERVRGHYGNHIKSTGCQHLVQTAVSF